jgi:hypothetical protein
MSAEDDFSFPQLQLEQSITSMQSGTLFSQRSDK